MNYSVAYAYDELNRMTNRAIDGVPYAMHYDALNRIINVANALGSFDLTYEGASRRVENVTFPNGITAHFDYFGADGSQRLHNITHRRPDSSVLSRFTYTYSPSGTITNWGQQLGDYSENWALTYDSMNRLLGVIADQAGTNQLAYAFAYDPADNLLLQRLGPSGRRFSYNALNEQVWSSSGFDTSLAYEWDAEQRLTALVRGTNRNEFAYDGWGRRTMITERDGPNTVSVRRLVWCGNTVCEERSEDNSILKRFFPMGEQQQGENLYYCRDHLSSVRQLCDSSGSPRATYIFEPFGCTRDQSGDRSSTIGFAGLFKHGLGRFYLTRYRAFDPIMGVWLSRDPIGEGGGLNLYSYVHENPINTIDPLGLDGLNAEESFGEMGQVLDPLGFLPSVGSFLPAVGDIVKGKNPYSQSVVDDLREIADSKSSVDDMARDIIKGKDPFDDDDHSLLPWIKSKIPGNGPLAKPCQ